MISNINSSLEEDAGEGEEKDYTGIDGYDEIPEEDQDRVRNALEQGHVADDDWKGVSLSLCLGISMNMY